MGRETYNEQTFKYILSLTDKTAQNMDKHIQE